MTLIQALNFVPFVLFIAFHIAERLWPAQSFPRSLGWRVKGWVWFMVGGAIFTNAPLLWKGWAVEHRLMDGSWVGLAGAPLAALVGNAIGYFWHRLRHSVPLLWRFHQLHHSADRLDISSAFMFHPLETVAVAFLGSITSTLILGISTDAAALGGTIGFFIASFTHANIRTPRWLGYFIQRPESHSVHHSRGVHAFNYADIPLFDMLFGTFKNPAERETRTGFFDGSSRQVPRMLAALDATRAPN